MLEYAEAVPIETSSTAQRSLGAKPSILLKPVTRRGHSYQAQNATSSSSPGVVCLSTVASLLQLSRAASREKFEASLQTYLVARGSMAHVPSGVLGNPPHA
jgi:hypothetical protein